jgi:Domain of unknown function (DUF4382)
MKIFQATLVAAVVSLLAACGGSSGPSSDTAPFSLSVTDTPINSADIASVCIDFNRITVHYASGQDTVLDYDPQPAQVTPETHCTDLPWDGTPPVPAVRLDALGGPLTVALAEGLQVPVGRVTWIRLHFTGGSYIMDNIGGQHDLRCPSCDVTDNNTSRGFKLNRTFEVTSAGIALTVDVDLLKSLHHDANGYVLRPTARVEVDQALGTIAGDVHEDVITAEGGVLFSGGDVDTGCAVYIYAGHDVTPDDYYYEGSTVVSTARVKYVETSGFYSYAAGGLLGGTEAMPAPYSVALTCDMDDPLTDDMGTDVGFTAAQNAEVIAGQVESISFSP